MPLSIGADLSGFCEGRVDFRTPHCMADTRDGILREWEHQRSEQSRARSSRETDTERSIASSSRLYDYVMYVRRTILRTSRYTYTIKHREHLPPASVPFLPCPRTWQHQPVSITSVTVIMQLACQQHIKTTLHVNSYQSALHSLKQITAQTQKTHSSHRA